MKTLVKVWREKKMASTMALMLMCMAPALAFGWAAPAAGDFGFDFYDFAINTFLHGPFGMLTMLGLGLGGLIIGISSRAGGWATGIPMMIIAGGLYNLENLATAIGWVV